MEKVKRFQNPDAPLDYAAIYKAANPGKEVPSFRIDTLRNLDLPIYSDNPMLVMYSPNRANPDNQLVSQDTKLKWDRSPFSGIEKTVGTAYLGADIVKGLTKFAPRVIPTKLFSTATTRRIPTGSEMTRARRFNRIYGKSYNDIYLRYVTNPKSYDNNYLNLLSNLGQLTEIYGEDIPLEELALANRPTMKADVPYKVVLFYEQDVAPRQLLYLTLRHEPHFISENNPYAKMDISNPWSKISVLRGYVPSNMAGWYDTGNQTLRVAEDSQSDTFAHELRHAALNLLEGADENLNKMPPGQFRISPSTRKALNDAYRFDPNGKHQSFTMYPELSEKQATNTQLRYKLWDKFNWNDITEGNKVIDEIPDDQLLEALSETNGYGAEFVNTIGKDLDLQIKAVETVANNPSSSVSHIMDNDLAHKVASSTGANRKKVEEALRGRVLKEAADRIRLALKYSPAATGIIIYNRNENQSK